MDKAIEILKSLLIPKLERDIYFQRIILKDTFWELLSEYFLNYENDAKPTYELLYALQLYQPERLLDKLPNVFSKFTKELAEYYVLGFHDKATNHLLQSKNSTFLAHVSFLQSMQLAIKKVERQNIKDNLPKSYERLTFELSQDEITNVITKIEREDLKAKFKEWDKELKKEKEPVIFYSLGNEKKMEPQQKVISFSWIKYAIAACLVLAGGVWFFKYSNPDIVPSDNGVVTNDKDTTPVVSPKIIEAPIEAIAYNTKVIARTVQYPSDLGFTNTKNSKVVTIYLKDASQSIAKFKNELARDFKGVAGYGPRYKVLEKEYNSLLSKQGRYEFNGKQLIIYTQNLKVSYSILSLDDKTYYLKTDNNYYDLSLTKLPLKFKQLKDATLIEQLEKTSFDNEE